MAMRVQCSYTIPIELNDIPDTFSYEDVGEYLRNWANDQGFGWLVNDMEYEIYDE